MAGNKGSLSGWEKGAQARKRLVYIPIAQHAATAPQIDGATAWGAPFACAIADATTKTATMAATLTSPLYGTGRAGGVGFYELPPGVNIRAVSVLMIARHSVVGDNYFTVSHFGGSYSAAGDMAGECHFGKVAGYYDTVFVPLVYTDSVGRFWWAVPTNSGATATLYLRVMGYWVERE